MGSRPKPTTQTTTAEPWAPQGSMLRQLFNEAQGYLNRGPQQAFPGSRVAPQSEHQIDAQDALVAAAPELAGQAQAAQAANQQLQQSYDVGNNPVVGRAIEAALNPLAKTFTERVLPSLRVGELGSGTSSRQGVLEANALNNFNQTSSDMVGRLMGDFYQSGLTASNQATSLAPALAAMTNLAPKNLALAGGAEQGFAQQLLNDEVARFTQNQYAPLEHLMNFRNLITGGFGGTTTSPTGLQQPSMLSQILGGGLTGFGATGNPYGAAAGAIIPFL